MVGARRATSAALWRNAAPDAPARKRRSCTRKIPLIRHVPSVFSRTSDRNRNECEGRFGRASPTGARQVCNGPRGPETLAPCVRHMSRLRRRPRLPRAQWTPDRDFIANCASPATAESAGMAVGIWQIVSAGGRPWLATVVRGRRTAFAWAWFAVSRDAIRGCATEVAPPMRRLI